MLMAKSYGKVKGGRIVPPKPAPRVLCLTTALRFKGKYCPTITLMEVSPSSLLGFWACNKGGSQLSFYHRQENTA